MAAKNAPDSNPNGNEWNHVARATAVKFNPDPGGKFHATPNKHPQYFLKKKTQCFPFL